MVLGYIGQKWRSFRSYFYDSLIVKMTSVWYREVMVTFAPGATVLDVGIGTATSLIANRDLIVSKNLHFHGVDYDKDYIDAATELVAKHQLQSHVALVCASIHDFHGGPFDVVYFSGSFMIIPDKVKALRHCCSMLRQNSSSVVCFTQTFEKRGLVGAGMSYLKPALKYLLTIDFGQVTYEEDFVKVLDEAGVEVVSKKVIAQSGFRSQVVIFAKPKAATSN